MRVGVNTMKPEERFTRTFFGIIMVLAAFVPWGRWVSLVMGVLFLFSAWLGYCGTCELYRKLNNKPTNAPER